MPLRLATFILESLGFAPSDPRWFEARAAVEARRLHVAGGAPRAAPVLSGPGYLIDVSRASHGVAASAREAAGEADAVEAAEGAPSMGGVDDGRSMEISSNPLAEVPPVGARFGDDAVAESPVAGPPTKRRRAGDGDPHGLM